MKEIKGFLFIYFFHNLLQLYVTDAKLLIQ